MTNGKSLSHKDSFVHFYGFSKEKCSRMGFQKKNVVRKTSDDDVTVLMCHKFGWLFYDANMYLMPFNN